MDALCHSDLWAELHPCTFIEASSDTDIRTHIIYTHLLFSHVFDYLLINKVWRGDAGSREVKVFISALASGGFRKWKSYLLNATVGLSRIYNASVLPWHRDLLVQMLIGLNCI